MTVVKRLYVIAGFDDTDVERRASELQRKIVSGTSIFIARPYPADYSKRVAYLKNLVGFANDRVFGTGAATNFCRRMDQPCSQDAENKSSKTCERSKNGDTACTRRRPQLIVMICAEQIFEEVFDRLGRGILIMRLPGPKLPADQGALEELLAKFEPIEKEVLTSITERKKTFYSPLVPDCNFQRIGGHNIAREIQSDPGNFKKILDKYHALLYKGEFRNPVKKGITGAYMLDDNTAFQEDHLHNQTQTIGTASRSDAFHLLNAYHVYGVKFDPGLHFDVMNVKGGAIQHQLIDRLTMSKSDKQDKHLNASPCDRLV